jgi:catalase
VHSYHRDGAMRVDGNYGGTAALRAQQLRPVAGAARLPRAAAGPHGAADHWNFREDDSNYYKQPGACSA